MINPETCDLLSPDALVGGVVLEINPMSVRSMSRDELGGEGARRTNFSLPGPNNAFFLKITDGSICLVRLNNLAIRLGVHPNIQHILAKRNMQQLVHNKKSIAASKRPKIKTNCILFSGEILLNSSILLYRILLDGCYLCCLILFVLGDVA